ncbi:General transcription and DNA repair factor IIH subunit TFB2 [Exophiala dermatitidis]
MADTTLQSWEYLETLPGTQFYRLYRSPASALAIFRKRLTSLAKSFVMMLVYMPAPVPVKQLELFVKDTSRGEREYAIDLLHRYHIFKDVTYNGAKAYALTPDFAKSLRRALTGAGDSRSFGQVATNVPEDQKVTIAQLDEYARQRWEGILAYMVGSSSILLESGTTENQASIQPSPGVIELLKAGHLIELTGTYSRGQAAKITKEGFAFVLQDINTQIWALLFLYVDNAEVFEMDKVDVLSFLFFVSSLELGLAYSTAPLDETQLRCLSDLVSFGIVYQPLLEDGTPVDYFYPTRLATTLTSDSSTTLSATNTTLGSSLSTKSAHSSTSSSAGTGKGFIIVETNYRLYAYTSSPLQIALLSLFVNLRSRHPNLVTGKMSKSSVQRAIQAGITADQIISYLTSHAHPQMRRHAQAEQARNADPNRVVPILPATILDQIHLWQLERDRMTTTPGFLLKDFPNQADYEAPCRYADEIGVLVWKNDKKRMFFVNRIEGVRAFMAERRANAQG